MALSGPLGGGKTVFVQGACRGLGVTTSVLSPTFAIVHEYAGLLPVYHIDCNRITEVVDMVALGLDEYLDSGAVTFIEWAERILPLLPEERIEVTFSADPEIESRRYVTIERRASKAAL